MKYMQKTTSSGFTLIELLVTIAIIAILIGMVMGIAGIANRKSAESQAQSQLQLIANALEEYRSETGQYPSDLTEIEGRYPTIEISLTDPWGNEFDYEPKRMNSDSPYLTYSLKSDGISTNTADDIYTSRESF